MYISKLVLENWRNFRSVEASLNPRVFIVGPNASGKSNLLDVFRFLRDLATTGGGLQQAVNKNRGGVSKIRCLSARTQSDIKIEVHLSNDLTHQVEWKYEIGFSQTGGGIVDARAKLKYERVHDKHGKLLCNRPNDDRKNGNSIDEKLLEYTWLEQPNANAAFREVAEFFEGIQYLHVVPQLMRDSKSFTHLSNTADFYGRNLIERINRANKKTQSSFLKRIEKALKLAVPQFSQLELVKDEDGIPHLQARYKHWRAVDAKQLENQFSDGTLRLIGFLWAMQDGNKPLLLEEPELSLHSAIVTELADIIHRLQTKKGGIKRQVILTTNSFDLLSNKGISPEEVLMLLPSDEGTVVKNPADDEEILALLKGGMSIAEAVVPKTAPKSIHQFSLQFD